MKNSTMVTGVFRDRDSAEQAYQVVSTHGYDKKDINVVMSEDTRDRYFPNSEGLETELGSKTAEGAGIGSAVGGTLGAVVAAIAAVGTTLLIPGLGLVIAGPLAAAVAGAGAGGITGGLVGALIGAGIPEARLKEYETEIKEGGVLMAVTPNNDEDAAHFEQAWKQAKGEKVYR